MSKFVGSANTTKYSGNEAVPDYQRLLLNKGSKCICPEENKENKCGNFCKNMSPENERNIIKKLMGVLEGRVSPRSRSRSSTLGSKDQSEKRYLIHA